MKRIISYFSIFLVGVVVTLHSACNDDSVVDDNFIVEKPEVEQTGSSMDYYLERGEYSQEIQVSDESGSKTTTLIVSSDSEEVLNAHLNEYKYVLIEKNNRRQKASVSGSSDEVPEIIEVKDLPLPIHKIVVETLLDSEDITGYLVAIESKPKMTTKATNPLSLVYYFSVTTYKDWMYIEYVPKTNDYSDGIIYQFHYKTGFLGKWRNVSDGFYWLTSSAFHPKSGVSWRLGVGGYGNRKNFDNLYVDYGNY